MSDKQVHAIILAGGKGTRLGESTPKQYVEVEGTPIIGYCLKTIQDNLYIQSIIIVCDEEWRSFLDQWMTTNNITKFVAYADSGESRQESVYSGLICGKENHYAEEDVVVVHDSARPNLSQELLNRIIEKALPHDGCTPMVTVKDTCYFSEDGEVVSQLINRDHLYAGQTPEAFLFGKYYEAHKKATKQELSLFRGTGEIAVKNGMEMHIVSGDDHNYKITTQDDLEKFIMEQKGLLGS